MRQAHAVPEVRAAEHALMERLPPGTLMQRAASGLAAVCGRLLTRVYGARVAVLAGSGDNGGDALYAGERLARRGAQVTAIVAGDRVHADGLAALRRAGGRVVSAGASAAGADTPGTGAGPLDAEAEAALDGADLIIDGLLGIGGRGGLREPYARLVARAARARDAIAVAVDVPSGVDASTGTVDGAAFRADVTVTFGTHKPGLLIDPGAGYAGVVELVDIGLGPYLPAPDVVAARSGDIAAMLPRWSRESDKYRRGVVGVLAGGERYPGAAVLTVGGAVHGGAGMVRFASTAGVVTLVRNRWPEAVTTILEDTDAGALAQVGRVQAWVVGPGLGTGDSTRRLLTEVLAGDVPVLMDADALTVLAAHRELLAEVRVPVVLTPHAGEMARLLGTDREEVEARRLHHVRAAAAEFGATVLLKGSTTLIAEPGRTEMRVNPTGTPLLATGGTGDVLSGLIGALLAAGLSPVDAATAGAYIHGLAARLAAPSPGTAPISAIDVAHALTSAFLSCHTD